MKQFIGPGGGASRSRTGTRSARRLMKRRRVCRADRMRPSPGGLRRFPGLSRSVRWKLRSLALALTYRLDQRLERLFDGLSDCRGGPTRFQRDAALIALLLQASTAAVASRLAPDARLQASGLLRVEQHGELQVLERVTALIRRDIPPEPDLYDQLLGKMTAEPLPWDAFAHLGQQAEVAVSVLRTALAGQEAGINILLYGPPGTGKTSFAAALAARIGANLRPVAETDEDEGEPKRSERLAGLRLAQCLAQSRNTVLLFDEAEDLFVGRSTLIGDLPSRVFIHRLLERMTVPVIWTANDIRRVRAGRAPPYDDVHGAEGAEPRHTDTAVATRWVEAEGVALSEPDAARLARLVPAAPAVAAHGATGDAACRRRRRDSSLDRGGGGAGG